jgi:hypothetical protein
MRSFSTGALLAIGCLAPAGAEAQACLRTLYVSNNGLGPGAGNYLDLTVLAPGGVTIREIEVNDNNNGTGGAQVDVEIYVTPGTYVGRELTQAAWSSVSKGSGVALPENTPTRIDVTDFTLPAGTWGVLVHHVTGGGPAYTNGTSVNQYFTDGTLVLDLGASQATPWSSATFEPRVWNGTFCYSTGGGFATYCTAKPNSLGCTPVISGTGSPSVTATSGFTVDCSLVRNGKSGLLFYKAGGTQASVTFQCGILCVGPPGIQRTPARSAGGSPPPANDCSGVYSLDMNAFAAGLAGGNPDPALLVAGTLVQCQWWGRDQGFAAPCNTTLSDGGEYMTQP